MAVPSDLGERAEVLVEKHAEYIIGFSQQTDTFEYYATEHFRLSGVYWGATALATLGRLHLLDAEATVAWTLSCRHENGGFGGSPRHDPHLLYTTSAVQLLALYDRLDLIDADATAAYVAGLQQPNGSFAGDEWGEIDTRCATWTCHARSS
mmetsp:Transcript_2414/g.7241  ORF Transcript_2414/g.7241 Transcript_2414/m.7241 type:complete len:151 (+) Transcript_2414:178-630(+)